MQTWPDKVKDATLLHSMIIGTWVVFELVNVLMRRMSAPGDMQAG